MDKNIAQIYSMKNTIKQFIQYKIMSLTAVCIFVCLYPLNYAKDINAVSVNFQIYLSGQFTCTVFYVICSVLYVQIYNYFLHFNQKIITYDFFDEKFVIQSLKNLHFINSNITFIAKWKTYLNNIIKIINARK